MFLSSPGEVSLSSPGKVSLSSPGEVFLSSPGGVYFSESFLRNVLARSAKLHLLNLLEICGAAGFHAGYKGSSGRQLGRDASNGYKLEYSADKARRSR